ncbi:MAG: glycerol kinase GlpK [Anaerovoracaceae bacterium]|jgi:glycerol kinase
MKKYIMALDQGTTSSRCIIFNKKGEIVSIGQKEFKQIFPHPGWVEHDPIEILTTQIHAVIEAMSKIGAAYTDIAALGITNQRETTVIWDRETGLPVYNAIVWQCRRTASICEDLKKSGMEDIIRERTGLILDAYFSGTKIKWILDNVEGAREKAEEGRILFGTVDTWLLWNLTGGNIHATDYSNASRTMLYNIKSLMWDRDILKALNIPASMLPEVLPSSGNLGETHSSFFGGPITIAGMAGDQQSALFGQNCFQPGMAKNTYGTGCFLLMNTGDKPVKSQRGLLTTIGWGEGGGVSYALEGSVFVAGAGIQWLRDELKILDNSAESERIALSLKDNGGIYFVPAFVGLGAPFWDPYARGLLIGITRGTSREHIIRAALESMAYQTWDVLQAMEMDSGIEITTLRADGGAAANGFLMQFQSDLIKKPVELPGHVETTAFGVACLAGLATGYWSSKEEISSLKSVSQTYLPGMEEGHRLKLMEGWRKAVKLSLGWAL